MADRYLLESGAPDGYLLEDGSGVLLLETRRNALEDLAVSLGAVFGFAVVSDAPADIIGGRSPTTGGTPTYTDGPQERAAVFDASGEFFSFPNDANLDFGDGPVSVFAVVRRDTDEGNQQGIVRNGTNAFAINLRGSDGSIGFGKQGVAFVFHDTGGEFPIDGEFHTVGVSYNGGTSGIAYRDGVAGTSQDSTQTLVSGSSAIEIGRDDTFFGGAIEYVFVFPSVLSASDFSDLHDLALFTGIALPLISQPVTLFQPRLDGQIQLGLISQPVTLFQPRLDGQVQVPLISQPVTLFEPRLDGQIQLGLISQPVTLFEPTLSAPSSTISPPLISQPVTLFQPRLDGQVQLPLISQPVTLFQPRLDGQVQLPLISSPVTLFQPRLDGQIQLGLISQPVTLFSPTISGSGLIDLPLISQPVSLFQPQLNGQLQLPLVSSPVTLFQPRLDGQIVLPRIDRPVTLFSPTLTGTGTIFLPQISQLLQLFAPTLTGEQAVSNRNRIRDIQMHAIVYTPDSAGGPGTPKMELDGDMFNMAWQQAMNYPGQAALTLLRFNPKYGQIDWMKDHIKIIRQDSRATKTVFSGKLVKPQEGTRDAVIYAWDYTAFLQRSRTGFRVLYPEKTIKEIVDAEWNLAKTVDKSPFEFVATGTTETPLALDGVTPIKTNNQFGVIDFDRLFLFFALAELSMANTDNNVVFEITREAPHTFNFWKNRSSNITKYAFTYPGNLIDYDFIDGHDQIVNDLATVIVDPTTGAQVEYALTDTASKDEYRRLQAATAIKTLYGISSGATETDQQKAALARLLSVSVGIPSLYTLFPRQGEITPFDGWDLGDKVRLTLMKPDRSGDLVDAYKRITGIAAAWSPEAGELMQVFVR